MKTFVRILFFIAAVVCCLLYGHDENHRVEEVFTALTVDAKTADVEFFWKDNAGGIFGSIGHLKKYAENHGGRLRFAMNGGMYQEDGKPLGLFVQNNRIITPLNTRRAEGNFYLQPNGVFYINNERQAFVRQTADYFHNESVRFATQSGPMLIADGQINSVFAADSQNLNIRNGVCVLENSKIVFAVSRRPVNFYDFAAYFKNMGCRNALYLDGFVSRMYAPEADITQIDGDFGVIIGIIE